MAFSKIFGLAGLLAGLAYSLCAEAGVTIHYEGRARDSSTIDTVLRIVRAEGKAMGWRVEQANEANAKLNRYSGEKSIHYEGPLIGVVLYPHPRCEPLYIQFDSNLLLQDFVKTQFAGPDIHVAVTNLLRKIGPHLSGFVVEDEGEYWATGDRARLEWHMVTVNRLLGEMKAKHPGARGPITLPNGRIVDLSR